MKRFSWLLLAGLLFACQPPAPQAVTPVYLVDGDKLYMLAADAVTPFGLAAQAGLAPNPTDHFLLNGILIPSDFPLPADHSYTLQILHTVSFTLRTPEGEKQIQSAALTVGEALTEAGWQLSRADLLDPPSQTPLTAGLTVTYRPAREYLVRVDGAEITVKSSAPKVGQVLASAGIPLLGLDYSLPAESAPTENVRTIEVVRVEEKILVTEKSIPFTSRYEYSSTIPAGMEPILQPGEPGLILSTVRVRYENGVEVARTTAGENVARLPKEQIIGRSTQVTVQTLAVPGGEIQYWRAVQMWATSYSPCRSGTEKCSYGTASGMQVQQGVVAMTRDLYYALGGTQVYIPGYGQATIADVGGGFPDGRLWIDLGYSDENWQNWSGWITVYFLAPAPATIPASLQ